MKLIILLLLCPLLVLGQKKKEKTPRRDRYFYSDNRWDTIRVVYVDSTGEVDGYVVREFGADASGKPMTMVYYLDTQWRERPKKKPKTRQEIKRKN